MHVQLSPCRRGAWFVFKPPPSGARLTNRSGSARLYAVLAGQGQSHGNQGGDEKQYAGAAKCDPMGIEGLVSPAAQPRAKHTAYLVSKVSPTIEHTHQAYAVNIRQDGGRQGNTAGPDDAADDGDGVELNMGADQ